MKKGFTLVELIAVIVILGLIGTVVYPSIISIINNSKEKAYESQKRVIVKAAKEWGVKNSSKLPDDSCRITVARLIKEGYIENDEINNPKGGKFNGIVEVKFESNQYSYTYIEDSEATDTCAGIFERYIDIIKASAKRWRAEKNIRPLESCKISVSYLISEGYIDDEEVINQVGSGNVEMKFKDGNFVYAYLEDDAPSNSCLGS